MPLDEPAYALAFTPDGAFAYALSGDLVSIIDTSALSVVYRVSIPDQAADIAIGTVPYGCVAPLNPIPTATRTSTPTATATPTQTKTPSVTRTSTPQPPTATDDADRNCHRHVQLHSNAYAEPDANEHAQPAYGDWNANGDRHGDADGNGPSDANPHVERNARSDAHVNPATFHQQRWWLLHRRIKPRS